MENQVYHAIFKWYFSCFILQKIIIRWWSFACLKAIFDALSPSFECLPISKISSAFAISSFNSKVEEGNFYGVWTDLKKHCSIVQALTSFRSFFITAHTILVKFNWPCFSRSPLQILTQTCFPKKEGFGWRCMK